MWYSISDGSNSISYGFGPKESGIKGVGKAYEGDDKKYQTHYYSRTIEITKEQYDKLKKFGKTAVEKQNSDFEKYHGLTNSCIDFTWEALKSADLNCKGCKTSFQGDVKVINNKNEIQKIQAPFPNSELNKEE